MDQNEKKKLRKLKAVEESDDEDEGKKGHGASLSRLFYACDTFGRRRFVETADLHNYFVHSLVCCVFQEILIDPLCIKEKLPYFLFGNLENSVRSFPSPPPPLCYLDLIAPVLHPLLRYLTSLFNLLLY